jgi:hypothetical protein
MRPVTVLAGVLLAGCLAAPSSPSGNPTDYGEPGSVAAHIRTEDRGSGCFMNSIGPFRLEGDPNASEAEQVWLVWLRKDESYADMGERLSPIWHIGTTAIFAPELRIIDQFGDVVLTEGATFTASGALQANHVVYVCDAGSDPPDS